MTLATKTLNGYGTYNSALIPNFMNTLAKKDLKI
jgi:hypothetical protein